MFQSAVSLDIVSGLPGKDMDFYLPHLGFTSSCRMIDRKLLDYDSTMVKTAGLPWEQVTLVIGRHSVK